jgi:hypothetical protein
VQFAAEKVALVQVSLRVFNFSPVSIIPSIGLLHTHSFIHSFVRSFIHSLTRHRRYIILANDSGVD